jgi:glycosyltransferase involved in cell wall biosynthesis
MQKAKVLCITHEARMTGAPIAAARTAAVLSKTFNSEIWTFGIQEQNYLNLLVDLDVELANPKPLLLHAYDVFICHSAASISVVGELIKHKKKVIWWIHEGEHLFDVVNSTLLNLCMNSVECLVFPSSYSAFHTFGHWVWKRYGAGVFIIPNYVPGERKYRSHELSNRFKRQILFMGGIRYAKGADLVWRAAALASSREEPLEFVIAGKSVDITLPDLPNCRFVGELDADNVNLLLDSSDVLVHPSRLDNQPLVVLEAIHAGLPALTTSIPGLVEFLSKEQLFVHRPIEIFENPDFFLQEIKALIVKAQSFEKRSLSSRCFDVNYHASRLKEVVNCALDH